eukprot:7248797-Lingulodinium_polyedra.AAC.1
MTHKRDWAVRMTASAMPPIFKDLFIDRRKLCESLGPSGVSLVACSWMRLQSVAWTSAPSQQH